MYDVSEQAVLRAISAMRERMGEQLTVDELARVAMFSKFHFSRVFQRLTGVSPARFLSAVRLQRAKELLLSTAMNVADISVHVGYNSVGTFSSRFSRSVGMSPTTYRRRDGFAQAIHPDHMRRSSWPTGARLSFRVRVQDGAEDSLIFVGLFADRIPEGRPVQCAIVPAAGEVMLEQVPLGTWYLLAQSVVGADPGDGSGPPVAVASCGPFTVRRDAVIVAEVVLRRARALDPPVLLALTDARKDALIRLGHSHPELAGRIAAVA